MVHHQHHYKRDTLIAAGLLALLALSAWVGVAMA